MPNMLRGVGLADSGFGQGLSLIRPGIAPSPIRGNSKPAQPRCEGGRAAVILGLPAPIAPSGRRQPCQHLTPSVPAHNCRLPRAAPEPSLAVNVESHSDGTVTFRFGAHPQNLAVGQHAILPVDGANGAAHSQGSMPGGAGAPANGHAVNGNGAASSSSASIKPPGAGKPRPKKRRPPPPSAAAGPAQVPETVAETAAQLEELLQLSSVPHPTDLGSADATTNTTTKSRAAAAAAATGRDTTNTASPDSPGSQHLGTLAAAVMQRWSDDDEASTSSPGSGVTPYAVDYEQADTGTLVRLYVDVCASSKLDDALHLMKQCIRAHRTDVLMK